MWISFWVLYPVPVIYVSFTLPIPHSLDCYLYYFATWYYSYIISLLFFPLRIFQNCLAIPIPLTFHLILEYFCLELKRSCWDFHAAAAKSLQSCPTLCDPIDGSPPGSPVPGILQARTLEWVAISFSNAWKWKVKVKSLSRVWRFTTPWTAAYQAPPSMGFSRQEYWSGLPLPSLIEKNIKLQKHDIYLSVWKITINGKHKLQKSI